MKNTQGLLGYNQEMRNAQLKRNLYSSGKDKDYISYVGNTFGYVHAPIRAIQGIMGQFSLDVAMEIDEPAIVDHIAPDYSLTGERVVTNVNNFSGTDTKLGLLTNHFYAEHMVRNSHINSLRRGIGQSVITGVTIAGRNVLSPYTYKVYGANSHHLNTLYNLFPLNPDTGRIIEDYNKDIKIYDIYSSLEDDASNGLINIINLKNTFLENENKTLKDAFKRYDEGYDTGDFGETNKSTVYSDNEDNDSDVETTDGYSTVKFGDASSEKSSEKQTENKINERSLLGKTVSLFKNHSFNTLYGTYEAKDNTPLKFGFEQRDDSTKDADSTKGRALFNSKGNAIRNWTYKKQYDRMSRLVKPFHRDGDETQLVTFAEVQKLMKRAQYKDDVVSSGDEYLAKNTVLSNYGYVNIAPSSTSNPKTEIKKCMFSIENLAWKDVYKDAVNLSKEQTGPNGGRIMWFPPYDINFNESVNVNWEGNTFIGRGEKIYTYSNTDRTGTLSFTMLIDHPSMLDNANNDSNISKGNVDGKDNENILRFLSGAELIRYKYRDDTEERIEANMQPLNVGRIQPKTTTDREINIYVFFPNNYSGNMRVGGDDDAIEYLLDGASICRKYGYLGNDENSISEEEKERRSNLLEQIGYEVNSEQGISDYYPDTGWTQIGNFMYRVDNDMSAQTLSLETNYIDTSSSELNTKTCFSDANYSFAELFCVLYSMDDDEKDEFVYEYISPKVNHENVRKLRDIIEKSNITEIICSGAATSQDNTNSKKLAKGRVNTIQKYLRRYIKSTIKQGDIIIEDLQNKSSINSNEAKKSRYVKITIKYTESKLDEFSKTDAHATNDADSYNPSGNTESNITEDKEGSSERNGQKVENMTINGNSLILDVDMGEKSVGRYETEAEYFDKLKHEDTFLYKTIQEKIKYFTPAFHSISPEGFNARLTFLHQCTRQGMTYEETSSEQARIAGNLAFGRMPVCILRIGDFIYTKILINTMTISYGDGGMQWDMNPEGIGMQPMMAKISLAITILGGQSLDGPINRLQNAITFNYYANTGVYDNRADRIKEKRTESGGNANRNKPSEENAVTLYNEGQDKYYLWNPVLNHENN